MICNEEDTDGRAMGDEWVLHAELTNREDKKINFPNRSNII